MRILVADASVLIDLERSLLVERAFRLDAEFVVPDVLYERELKAHNGPALLRFGLQVMELDAAETADAQSVRQGRPAISVPDAFAFALARGRKWPLLAGDGALRALAEATGMECHGVLWLMDQMLAQTAATARQLHDGLTALSKHPRCRLPVREIHARLKIYAERA